MAGFYDLYRRKVSCETSDKDLLQCEISQDIKDQFPSHPNYYKITKNLDLVTEYEVHIQEGDKEDKNTGYKKLFSYPYDTVSFFIGDYINWEYGGLDTSWLLFSIDVQYLYSVNGRMEKCNNILRWNDENGVTQTYPCVMKDIISDSGIRENKTIATFIGDIQVKVQLNAETNKLVENDRFLFDNLNSFSDEQTTAYKMTNNKNIVEGKILELYMSIDQINEATDDIVNKIADAYENVYTVNVDQDDFEQSIGYSSTLTATVKLNDEISSESVVWSSSDILIGTIDANTGVINLIANGNVTFTATMVNNSTVSDSVIVDVVAVPVGTIEVRFNPTTTSINQGTTETYNVVKYLDDVAQADTFAIVDSGANTDNYTFTVIDGNNFSVTGNGYDSSDLVITATSNADSSVGIINIKLNGLW